MTRKFVPVMRLADVLPRDMTFYATRVEYDDCVCCCCTGGCNDMNDAEYGDEWDYPPYTLAAPYGGLDALPRFAPMRR